MGSQTVLSDSRQTSGAGPGIAQPVISVITPSLNGGAYFRHTLQTILSQVGRFRLEWIIVDGGSVDGTVDLIKSIDDPRVRWVSEADGGQAAAINRGLAMAKGDIVTWLNCDDLYLPGALDKVAAVFQRNLKAQWLVGRCGIIDQQGEPIRNGVTHYKNRLLRHFSLKALLRINMISQPAVFWRRDFGEAVGALDESLFYTMDYDLWLRMAKACPPTISNDVLANFRVHLESKSRGGRRAQFDEGYRVACRYFDHDRISRLMHRLNVEKIVWAYRALRWIGD
jgi:glycosyltransferase involved in cell wall biosynthesis